MDHTSTSSTVSSPAKMVQSLKGGLEGLEDKLFFFAFKVSDFLLLQRSSRT